jgi:hypothetical protein
MLFNIGPHNGGKMIRKHIAILAVILVVVGASAYLGIMWPLEKDAKNRVQHWANQTGRISEISFKSLDVGLLSRTILVSQISLRTKDSESPIAIDRIVLHPFDMAHEIPEFMHVEIEGIHINRADAVMKGAFPVLSQLGYENLVAGVEYAYRYDPTKKDLEVQQMRVQVSDMGQIEVSARLNNLHLDAVKSISDNPFALIALMPAVAISKITGEFQDFSLTRRLIQMGARNSGVGEDQFLSDILQRLNLEILKQKNDRARDRLLALQNFLKNPGVIRISVSPAEPVPLMRFVMMENPEKMIDLLNISLIYQGSEKNKHFQVSSSWKFVTMQYR